jgi:molybdopterin-guanine dinucleotide biosynthesis protein A
MARAEHMHAISAVVMGILVGGQARRMGGVQKALLRPPHGDAADTLVAALARMGRAAGLEVVLLGEASLGPAALDLPQLPDAEPGVGPLGGLSSLLAYAAERRAVAIACDMPYVTAALLARLLNERPQAMLLAPRDPRSGKWQALFARYDPQVRPVLSAALADGERSFQRLFARIDVTELTLTGAEHDQLRDWDTPEDMRR